MPVRGHRIVEAWIQSVANVSETAPSVSVRRRSCRDQAGP